MAQEKENSEVAKTVDGIDAAYLVVRELYTRIEPKKHGSYLVYEDDKVIIHYDTYYPNLEVQVKMPEGPRVVLCRSGHGYNQEYHRGAWEAYLDGLVPKAEEAKRARESELQEKQNLQQARAFSRIDDSSVFGEAH